MTIGCNVLNANYCVISESGEDFVFLTLDKAMKFFAELVQTNNEVELCKFMEYQGDCDFFLVLSYKEGKFSHNCNDSNQRIIKTKHLKKYNLIGK